MPEISSVTSSFLPREPSLVTTSMSLLVGAAGAGAVSGFWARAFRALTGVRSWAMEAV